MKGSKGRILLVEDHQDTLEIIHLSMQILGYEVSSASTLADAFILAGDGDFDLYLVDGKLPDGTGIEFCKQIRKFDFKTPILFCSASAYPYNIEEAMAAGAQDYLTKPVDLAILEQTISKLLRDNLGE